MRACVCVRVCVCVCACVHGYVLMTHMNTYTPHAARHTADNTDTAVISIHFEENTHKHTHVNKGKLSEKENVTNQFVSVFRKTDNDSGPETSFALR